LVSYKSTERVSIVSTSAFHSTQASARRWLQLTVAACLTTLLVACGGGGSGVGSGGGGSADVAAVDAGAADNQPWKAVFNGSSSLTFNATGCSGPAGSTDTAVVTLTRGTNTFVASITSGSVTLGPYTIGDDNTRWDYGLSVGTGTSTRVDLYASLNNVYFSMYNFDGQSQNVYFNDSVAGYIGCGQVTNPLTRAQLNLQPQARLASFLAGTPTGVVSSVDSAPGGCYMSGGGTYTYAISPQGVTQIDGVTLAANWLDTVNDSRTHYSENASNISPTLRYSYINFVIDSAYRGVYLIRDISSSTQSQFAHDCGDD
jgi:hypothetical protein